MHPWWTDQQAGLIGAIGGSAIGLFGGIYGTVAGICGPRGKCKTLVFAMTYVAIVVGWSLVGLGIIALTQHQPYAVWYPLLLGGGMDGVLFTAFFFMVKARYREAENRRLDAEQLRRG